MQTTHLIPAEIFCAGHHIDLTFIQVLQQAGLVEITKIEEQAYVTEEQLTQLETMVRLYYSMDINVEGIETITHLLQRIKLMQLEIISLKNRLSLYEEA